MLVYNYSRAFPAGQSPAFPGNPPFDAPPRPRPRRPPAKKRREIKSRAPGSDDDSPRVHCINGSGGVDRHTRAFLLPLLPSGPGGVGRPPFARRSGLQHRPRKSGRTESRLGAGIDPTGAGCGLQGTASSPSCTAAFIIAQFVPEHSDAYRGTSWRAPPGVWGIDISGGTVPRGLESPEPDGAASTRPPRSLDHRDRTAPAACGKSSGGYESGDRSDMRDRPPCL